MMEEHKIALSAAQLAVMPGMLARKKQDQEAQEQQDTTALGKDAAHLHGADLKEVEQAYMPAINQIEAQLLAMDERTCKRASENHVHIHKHKGAPNKDETMIKVNTIRKFVDAIQKESQFYGIAKHCTKPTIAQKQADDPAASFYLSCQSDCVLALPTLAKI